MHRCCAALVNDSTPRMAMDGTRMKRAHVVMKACVPFQHFSLLPLLFTLSIRFPCLMYARVLLCLPSGWRGNLCGQHAVAYVSSSPASGCYC